MNCIFDSFNKKEATANPFLQPNKNDPGKFTFPTGSALAQAVQAQGVSKAPTSGPSFSFSNTTSGVAGSAGSGFGGFGGSSTNFTSGSFGFGHPTQTPSFAPPTQQPRFGHPTQTPSFAPFFPTQQPQSLFPAQTQQTFFPSQQPQSLFPSSQSFLGVSGAGSSLASINTAPQQTSVKLTKYTSKITIEKVIALLSSEWYVKDEDITVISQLNPACDAKDVTKVAPIAAAVFVDETSIAPLTQLPKIHVKFLQELVQETVKTEEDVWERVIDLATSHGMYNIIKYINAVRPHKTLTIQQQQITPEIAFVLAVHAFVTNNDRPHEVMTVSKRYSKDVAKLAADMCMASYGLSWILKTQTQDYIRKHRNTYILSC